MDFLEKILKEKANEVNNLTPVEKRVEKQRPSFYQAVKGNPKKSISLEKSNELLLLKA